MLNALRNSTRGLSRRNIAINAVDEVLKITDSMIPGQEFEHLLAVFSLLDHRGSDVRLESGSILESSRQAVPYPATAWKWKTVQSYHWNTTHHINVFELAAFFNFLSSEFEAVA